MKHRKTGRTLGRVRSQRKALMRTMLGSLILHERIETTEAKAKELKPLMDRMITRAKRAAKTEQAKMAVVRILEGEMPQEAIIKLREEILPRVESRTSGYTRVVKLSPRKSDGAAMAIIEFVDKASAPSEDTSKKSEK